LDLIDSGNCSHRFPSKLTPIVGHRRVARDTEDFFSEWKYLGTIRAIWQGRQSIPPYFVPVSLS
jgi:hypothetical protein